MTLLLPSEERYPVHIQDKLKNDAYSIAESVRSWYRNRWRREGDMHLLVQAIKAGDQLAALSALGELCDHAERVSVGMREDFLQAQLGRRK